MNDKSPIADVVAYDDDTFDFHTCDMTGYVPLDKPVTDSDDSNKDNPRMWD